MVSFVAVTTRWPDFRADFAAECLGGGGAGACAGSLGASVRAGGEGSGFGGAGGFADTAFFAGAFGRLGLAAAGLGGCSASCRSDCQRGTWEAALLGRSFFDSGCLE